MAINTYTIDDKLKTSGTYQKCLKLIPQYSIANLNPLYYDLIGFEFLNFLYNHLVQIRVCGYSYFAVNNGLFLDVDDGIKKEVINGETSFFIMINGKKEEIEKSFIIELGSNKQDYEGKFLLTKEQQKSLIYYESMVDKMYLRDSDSIVKVLKTEDYTEALRTQNQTIIQKLKKQAENWIHRDKNNLVLSGKEDTIESMQTTVENIAINEIKEKVSIDTEIPYSMIFKGASSGYGIVEKEEKKMFNIQVAFFSANYTLPAIKKYCKIIGKEVECNQIKMQPPEWEDKLILEDIKSSRIQNIMALFNSGLLTEEEAKKQINQLGN